MEKPEQIPEEKIDLTDLKNACQDYIDSLESKGFDEDEDEHFVNEIFEKAIVAVFGEEIWDFINSKIE